MELYFIVVFSKHFIKMSVDIQPLQNQEICKNPTVVNGSIETDSLAIFSTTDDG